MNPRIIGFFIVLGVVMFSWLMTYGAWQYQRVAAGVVQTGEDLVDKDPQLRHRGHFVEVEHAEMGKHLTEKPPYRLSKTPSHPQRPFPSFGEHTEFVCKDILAMGDEEFAELIGAGVLA